MVNERALMEAFQNIKKEFQSIRHDIDEINSKLNLANGHSHEHHEHEHNHNEAPSPDMASIREQLEKLNSTEDDIIESLERELKAHQIQEKKQETKSKKSIVKEVEEFIGDVNIDTEDIAEDYY